MQRTVRGFTDGRASPEMVAKENGFEVGMYIRRKSDKCLEKIEAFVGDKVHISIEEGPLNAGKASLSVAVLLSGKWRVTELKGKPEKVNFMSPVLSSELQAHVIKAQIVQKLWEMEKDCQHVSANLTVQVKPKGVFTTAPFPKNQLKLVPVTWKVESMEIGSAGIQDKLGICLGQWTLGPGMSPKHTFFLQGVYIPEKDGIVQEKSFLGPFWFIRSTTTPADANVEYHPKLLKHDQENRHGQIPFLRNFKPLGTDEELILHIPKVEEVEHLTMLSDAAAAPKPKRRRAKGPDA